MTLLLTEATAYWVPCIVQFCEFFEAAVHTVLHAKEIYGKETFEPCRWEDAQFPRSRHPDVQAYIGKVVAQLQVGASLTEYPLFVYARKSSMHTCSPCSRPDPSRSLRSCSTRLPASPRSA